MRRRKSPGGSFVAGLVGIFILSRLVGCGSAPTAQQSLAPATLPAPVAAQPAPSNSAQLNAEVAKWNALERQYARDQQSLKAAEQHFALAQRQEAQRRKREQAQIDAAEKRWHANDLPPLPEDKAAEPQPLQSGNIAPALAKPEDPNAPRVIQADGRDYGYVPDYSTRPVAPSSPAYGSAGATSGYIPPPTSYVPSYTPSASGYDSGISGGYTNPNHVLVHGKHGDYMRTAPNHTTSDNFSHRGNTNPYTGKRGSRR